MYRKNVSNFHRFAGWSITISQWQWTYLPHWSMMSRLPAAPWLWRGWCSSCWRRRLKQTEEQFRLSVHFKMTVEHDQWLRERSHRALWFGGHPDRSGWVWSLTRSYEMCVFAVLLAVRTSSFVRETERSGEIEEEKYVDTVTSARVETRSQLKEKEIE